MRKLKLRSTAIILVVLAVMIGSAWRLLRFGEQQGAEQRNSNGAAQLGRVASPSTISEGASAPLPKPVAPGVPKALFTYVKRPGFANTIEAKLPAPAKDIRYVELDRAMLEGKQSPLWLPGGQGVLSIPLPDGGTLTARIDRSEMLDGSRFTSLGHIEGQEASRVLITGNSSGQYSIAVLDVSVGDGAASRLASYTLRATGEAVAQFYEVDPNLMPPCGGSVTPVLDEKALITIAERKAAASLATSGTGDTVTPSTAAATDASSTPIVDLMMVYAPNVIASLSGDSTSKVAAIQSAFDLAVAQVNTAFSRSHISASVRLVKITSTAYNGTHVDSATLAAIRGEAAVNALRDQVGADLVSLSLVSNPVNDGSSIGIGYLLNTPAIVDAGEGFTNDIFAYSVVSYGYLNGSNLLSHELGHNFGAQHDRDTATRNSEGPGAFSYSYGYRFFGKNGTQYRTIMAYEPGIRLSYFSNPDIIASEAGVGVAVGVAVGQTGESNNALTLQKTAFEVANFRKQMVTSFYAGRMLGLATRAYVGPGEQQLIGGIALSGSKQIILRASGPSLLAQGVSGVLANPKITLNRLVTNPGMVESNDDWVKLPNKAEFQAASNQVHLTDLSSTLESALLLTLDGGAYSSNIEGAEGGTGIALMEAYEITSTGDLKLTGMSTRGYADVNGKEMIAGLNIEGAAGQTKRVIIRVLGPTLSQQGITTAMDDPLLELHALDGSLLLTNDDWTSESQTTSGVQDDFKPIVTYYHETEISNTGFAPKNRREPAIMVDLLPGIYTVVVKPFESLTSVPAQPATPGVVLVEVYELMSTGKVN